MAFGVLYDFTGNSNASKITKAKDMVQQSWFTSAVSYSKPIDLFVVLGHNPIRVNDSSSTMGTIYQAIRKLKPDTPIQMFGGHSHSKQLVALMSQSMLTDYSPRLSSLRQQSHRPRIGPLL
jgi:hypothetical protein